MSMYICNICLSNSCKHVDPRLVKQLAERYVRNEITLGGINRSELIRSTSGTLKPIDSHDPVYGFAAERKKLLLLRSNK